MEEFAVYKLSLGYWRLRYRGDRLIGIANLEGTPSSEGQRTMFTDRVAKELEEYFRGERKKFDIEYELEGTEFQKKVWQALLTIPYGETRSYKDIAIAVGNPKASRAVGMANNKNHIAIIVPCHRVIGSNGKLVGYAGGLDVKEALLRVESEKISHDVY